MSLKWFEWLSTLMVIFSVYLTTTLQLPENMISGFIASCMWIILAIAWNKYSLILINGILAVMYVIGVIQFNG